MYLTNIIDYNSAKEHMKKNVQENFGRKGEEVVKANYLAIDEAN